MFTADIRSNSEYPVGVGMAMTPTRWSDAEFGGPDMATIEVAGEGAQLGVVRSWLGYRVAILNAAGTEVWWGFVNEIEVRDGLTALTMSLDDVANRVAVSYTTVDGTGSSTSETTAWAEEGNSVAAYGKKELLLTLSDTSQAQAEDYRDQALALKAWPMVRLTPDNGAPGASLGCKGLWHKLGWTYFSTTAGRELHEPDVDLQLPISAHYTATTVSFAPADNIYDSANRLAWANEWGGGEILVKGSASNNGTWTVDDAVRDHINVDPGSIVTESAGASVTLVAGKHHALRVAQSFVITATVSWALGSLALQLGRAGRSPATHTLIVEICSNSAGNPGTVLWSTTLGLETLGENGVEWVDMLVAPSVTLAPATTYWIVARRTYADPWNYPLVGLSQAAGYAGGQVKMYDTAWYVPSPVMDMAFRLQGKKENTGQVTDIVVATAEFGGVVDVLKQSGRDCWQWRDGFLSSLDEVMKLLEAGATDGIRLLATVGADKRVRIMTQAQSSDALLVYGADRQMRAKVGGGLVEPGRLLAGSWIEVDSPVHGRQSVYVASSEYSMDGWGWTPAGASDWFDRGVRKG